MDLLAHGLSIVISSYTFIVWLNYLHVVVIPLSCNFVGEFFSLLGVFEYSYVVGVIASFGTVLSAAYSIYLYNRVCFGLPSKFLCYSRDLNRREFYTLFTLVTLIYLMGIFPFLAIDVIKSLVILQE